MVAVDVPTAQALRYAIIRAKEHRYGQAGRAHRVCGVAKVAKRPVRGHE